MHEIELSQAEDITAETLSALGLSSEDSTKVKLLARKLSTSLSNGFLWCELFFLLLRFWTESIGQRKTKMEWSSRCNINQLSRTGKNNKKNNKNLLILPQYPYKSINNKKKCLINETSLQKIYSEKALVYYLCWWDFIQVKKTIKAKWLVMFDPALAEPTPESQGFHCHFRYWFMEPSPLVKIPIESFAKGDDLGGFGSLASATQLDQLLRQCSLLLQACEDFGKGVLYIRNSYYEYWV